MAQYQNETLSVESVSLTAIANKVGTPCYVYSRKKIEDNFKSFENNFQNPHQINYAVKANSNLAVLNILTRLNAGFDIVSKGELARVLKAGARPQTIVFSGIGKTSEELQMALDCNVGCINVESEAELQRLNEIASHINKIANIAFRINPDVNAESHPYISTGLKENKFGISIEKAQILYQKTLQLPYINAQSLAFHIGSQITSLTPFIKALRIALKLIDDLAKQGIIITDLNVGGGLGVRYSTEDHPPSPAEYIHTLYEEMGNRKLKLHIEPGRSITANAGLLLTKVEYLKDHFIIVDTAMNDLLRPALYGSWQEIIPVRQHPGEKRYYDIVGPICETGDFLGKNRLLNIKSGELLAILNAGAYGFSMSSNYNSRPRACEVMVDKTEFRVVRRRENIEDLFFQEFMLS